MESESKSMSGGAVVSGAGDGESKRGAILVKNSVRTVQYLGCYVPSERVSGFQCRS